MKISQFKQYLDNLTEINIVQSNGMIVPKHFHITEAGLTTKHFIDCGGTVRTEKAVSLQVWVAEDTEHKLEPKKLKKIIDLSEKLFEGQDLEVEVEYQTETISRYGLDFVENNFVLISKFTDCLAKNSCGTPSDKQKIALSELQSSTASSCVPGGGCC